VKGIESKGGGVEVFSFIFNMGGGRCGVGVPRADYIRWVGRGGTSSWSDPCHHKGKTLDSK
jgi:hypothetical protein